MDISLLLLFSTLYSTLHLAPLREGTAAAAGCSTGTQVCLLACLQASYAGDAIADGDTGQPCSLDSFNPLAPCLGSLL